jgi:hypothetical protein
MQRKDIQVLSNGHETLQAVRERGLNPLSLLFEKHHKRPYNFILGMTGRPDDVEDLVHEVFLRMLNYYYDHRAPTPGPFSAGASPRSVGTALRKVAHPRAALARSSM